MTNLTERLWALIWGTLAIIITGIIAGVVFYHVYQTRYTEIGKRNQLNALYHGCREGSIAPLRCESKGVEMTWEVL